MLRLEQGVRDEEIWTLRSGSRYISEAESVAIAEDVLVGMGRASGTSYSSNYKEQLSAAPVSFRMGKRRNEIDNEIEHLRRLEGQMTDQRTLDGIKLLITDLEAEKAALPPDEKGRL